MKNETRKLMTAYSARIAQLNGVENAAEKFTVSPTVEQTIEQKIQESSSFLTAINSQLVDEKEGQKIGLGVTGSIARRTDTSVNKRKTKPMHSLDSDQYLCSKTEFDTHVNYATLDAWAKFPQFQTMLASAVLHQMALDRITIGFNGVTVATESDPVANPLLEDMNRGWLQAVREEKPEAVHDSGATEGQLRVGPGGDYKNMDALVMDAIESMMPTWARQRGDLVVITNSAMLHQKYFPLVDDANAPTEINALNMLVNSKYIGGKVAAIAPMFPEGSMLITPLKNLSIYAQKGSRRRHLRDDPEQDRYQDFQSVNESYVVENYDLAVLIENVVTDWE